MKKTLSIIIVYIGFILFNPYVLHAVMKMERKRINRHEALMQEHIEQQMMENYYEKKKKRRDAIQQWNTVCKKKGIEEQEQGKYSYVNHVPSLGAAFHAWNESFHVGVDIVCQHALQCFNQEGKSVNYAHWVAGTTNVLLQDILFLSKLATHALIDPDPAEAAYLKELASLPIHLYGSQEQVLAESTLSWGLLDNRVVVGCTVPVRKMSYRFSYAAQPTEKMIIEMRASGKNAYLQRAYGADPDRLISDLVRTAGYDRYSAPVITDISLGSVFVQAAAFATHVQVQGVLSYQFPHRIAENAYMGISAYDYERPLEIQAGGSIFLSYHPVIRPYVSLLTSYIPSHTTHARIIAQLGLEKGKAVANATYNPFSALLAKQTVTLPEMTTPLFSRHQGDISWKPRYGLGVKAGIIFVVPQIPSLSFESAYHFSYGTPYSVRPTHASDKWELSTYAKNYQLTHTAQIGVSWHINEHYMIKSFLQYDYAGKNAPQKMAINLSVLAEW